LTMTPPSTAVGTKGSASVNGVLDSHRYVLTTCHPVRSRANSRLSMDADTIASTGTSTSTSTSTSTDGLAALSQRQYPQVPWPLEFWSTTTNRYERIATNSPLTGTEPLSAELVQQQIDCLPDVDSPADFVAVCDLHGRFLGLRPKLATWPLSAHELAKNKAWSV